MEPDNSHYFAAIMAGGAGTRFWPASRRANPKPFLDLFGRGPLVALTQARVLPVVGEDSLFFVLGESLRPALARACPGFLGIGEPIARNTLGAVLIALGHVLSKDPDGRLAILPADHSIGDEPRFQQTLRHAFRLAEKYVVTLGVRPAYAETGYGYIRRANGPLKDCPDGVDGYPVAEFTEKPDRETAEEFVSSGSYFWNAGIFILPAARFTEMARAVDPYYGEVVDVIAEASRSDSLSQELLTKLLEPLPNINIDKAVMEHCKELAVIPADFPWSDVGTWDAAYDEREAGTDNLVVGDARVVGGRGNVAVATTQAPTVVLYDVDDLVVVATEDAVLVTHKGNGQKVGEVVGIMRDEGRDDLM
jgi:mannose-1-phosphate guanylyltransferase